MKLSLVVTILFSFIAMGAYADKPEWAGKGKPTAEQKAAHKAAMNAKEDDDEDYDEDDDGNGKDKNKAKKEKVKKDKKAKKEKDDDDDSDRQSGLEKQKTKKSEQEQKELDKGSDRGKEARETRRKWWQFWGGEEE